MQPNLTHRSLPREDELHVYGLMVIFGFSSKCFSQLQTLIQSADLGSDYRIDRALNEACESVIQTACKHIRNGDPM